MPRLRTELSRVEMRGRGAAQQGERFAAMVAALEQEAAALRSEVDRVKAGLAESEERRRAAGRQLREGKAREEELAGQLEQMKALFFFEVEEWQQSLDSFIKSIQIYKQLSGVSDRLSATVFLERIEQSEQRIRYCNHKISILTPGQAQSTALEDILKDRTRISDPILKEKLAVAPLSLTR